MARPIACPWCGHEETAEAAMQYHIEERHTEDSPFVVKAEPQSVSSGDLQGESSSSTEDAIPRLKCTRTGCGQYVELRNIDEHLRDHDVAGSLYEYQPASSTAKTSQSNAKSKGKASSGSLFSFLTKRSSNVSSLGSSIKKARLGREELGYHAFEKAMPSSVRKTLEAAERPVTQQQITKTGRLVKTVVFSNQTSGLIDALASICRLSDSTTSYLCHRSMKHIHRVKCDGNFCGYWNIQMLLSYIIATSDPDRGLPTVLQIQETIEAAWDEGICAYGRIETGGIHNTRKWIGTHEALAFFTKLGLAPSAASFKHDPVSGRAARDELLDFVEAYFCTDEEPISCTITDRPPIYLQHAGHSITIVGIQRRKSGKRLLVVFDPSHDTAPVMTRLINGASVRPNDRELLEPYLRPERRLAQWNEYEVLTIDSCEGLKLP